MDVIKWSLWTLQLGCMGFIVLMWVLVTIGIGTTDVDHPEDAFTSNCVLGQFP